MADDDNYTEHKHLNIGRMIGVSLSGKVAQEIFWYMICSQGSQYTMLSMSKNTYATGLQANHLVLSAANDADQNLPS